jgi:hypothetical protein
VVAVTRDHAFCVTLDPHSVDLAGARIMKL